MPLTSHYLGANLRRRVAHQSGDGGPVRGSCPRTLVGRWAHLYTSNLTLLPHSRRGECWTVLLTCSRSTRRRAASVTAETAI